MTDDPTGFGRRIWARRGIVAVISAALALLASCASVPSSPGQDIYAAAMWPARPKVELSFDVAPDLGSVTGRESVVFTPDAPTCELVFRAWPNSPTISATGGSLVVTDTAVAGRAVTPQVIAAGAPDGAPGTLIQVPLPSCLAAGQSVQADLGFRLTLGPNADERVGHSVRTETAWFGSAFPLLAWIRGQGWARDPAVPMNGETAASEDFALSALSVTAPNDFQVQGTGTAVGDSPGSSPGTTTHHFTAPAVRDVTVGVGRYDILNRDIGGVHLHLATPSAGTKADPNDWADQIEDSVTSLTKLFGPFPYPDFWVTITPGQSDGTEYPAALQMSDSRKRGLRALVAHEVSHQWFYSLVGNNQAENPWMDEALATFGEANAGGDASDYQYDNISSEVVGLMGQPMSFWVAHCGYSRYTKGVYNQGAAVLLEARRRVGADKFDPALRDYIKANAHRVATPNDFAKAFADQPQVLDLLRQAGALNGIA
jgi:peptidase M1-like protein